MRAGRVAVSSNSAGIDLVLPGVFSHPPYSFFAIVDLRGKFVLWRQAIVDIHDGVTTCGNATRMAEPVPGDLPNIWVLINGG